MTNTITDADAIRQQEAIRKIMADQKLDFGPAVDVYIRQRHPYDKPTIILSRK